MEGIIGDKSGRHYDTNHLIAASTILVNTLTTDSTQYIVISDTKNADIMVERNECCHGIGPILSKFYFDRVNLPTYLLSPEIMTIIANRTLIKIIGQNRYELKPEYVYHPFLAPMNNPHLDERICIPLTDELITCCKKYLDKSWKYAPLGNSEYESLEQQMENFMISGRADRVLNRHGPTGPCIEDTVHEILKENNKKIKSCNMMIGSFPSYRSPKVIKKEHRWIRIVMD